MVWEHAAGDKYVITGVDRAGKRFKITTENPWFALGHNVWQGHLWLVRGGRRKLVHTWRN